MHRGNAPFARRVVDWQKQHGRNDLPWQGTQDPYRVWLSEVMLQQTQVATVRDYYARFLNRFPDVQSLASATLDDVLALWSGLGYYSRARNLHACAQAVVREHGGQFPRLAAALETLPGIGRSTAAAIASICFGERAAILDANVRRVLARLLRFEGDLAQARAVQTLWTQATALLPAGRTAATDMPRYTQGLMDLGATVCLPRNPQCGACPVQPLCAAHQAGDVLRYPVRSRTLRRSSQSIWLLWAQTPAGAVWLHPRPTPGVWAGLHCLALFDSEAALLAVLPHTVRDQAQALPVQTHALTHKDLHLHTWRVTLPARQLPRCEGRWVASTDWPSLGLPAPIRALLQKT